MAEPVSPLFFLYKNKILF